MSHSARSEAATHSVSLATPPTFRSQRSLTGFPLEMEISSLAQHQSHLLAYMQTQNSQILSELVRITRLVRQSGLLPDAAPDCTPAVQRVKEIVYGTSTEKSHQLRLANEIPSPIIKQQGFQMQIQVLDVNGEVVVLPECVRFRVLLFTSEASPIYV